MIGKYDGGQVVLRWYPGSSTAWNVASRYGYRLERATLPDTLAEEIDTFSILENKLLPYTVEKFGELYKKNENKYLAMAAQMMHGKREKLSKPDSEVSVFQKAEIMDNMYSITMLCAEFDREASKGLALCYEDTNIKKGAAYAYRVLVMDTLSSVMIDTAYVIVRTNKVETVTQPSIAQAYWGDEVIKLEWEKDNHKNAFSAYHIERSDDDGNSYARITKDPYVYSNTINTEHNFIYYDSIPSNDKKYLYRLIGINSFAESSPPSEPVTISGRDVDPPSAPYSIKTKYLGGSRMEITWQAKDTDGDLKGFMISKSERKDAGYTNLTPEGLPKDSRTWVDENFNRLANNYYFVGAYDIYGNGNVGLPVYGNYVDSIPPAPVKDLGATIDTNGILKLEWASSPEKDVMGYFIHYANQEDHVFTAINGKPQTTNLYTDTLNIKDIITEEIFYRVVAVDYNMNYSKYSETLKVKKPDVNPPAAPVFQNYKVEDDAITLKWANSSSKDVASHTLQKRERGTEEWERVKTLNYNGETYSESTDRKLVPNTKYEYRVIANDDDGLTSPCPDDFVLHFKGEKVLEAINNVKLSKDAENKFVLVEWDLGKAQFDFVTIYKQMANGKMVAVKTLNASDSKYKDREISLGSEYSYYIKATQSETGKSSKFSSKQSISI